MINKFIYCFLVTNCLSIHGITIDRVILSSDANPTYLEFWPLVARAWKDRIGIKPTLALIAEDDVVVDTTLGEVIRIKPIEGISTAMQAQVIRLLLPIHFPDEISIISDIDMLPLNKEYFINSVANIPDDMFVVYRDMAYGPDSLRFPMCYNVGKGSLFSSIFNVHSIEEIPAKIKEWASFNWGWATDEVALYTYVRGWKYFKDKCVFLHHTSMEPQRIDRVAWGYDKEKLKNNYYIDAHMVRPLNKYYSEIKELANDLGLILEERKQ